MIKLAKPDEVNNFEAAERWERQGMDSNDAFQLVYLQHVSRHDPLSPREAAELKEIRAKYADIFSGNNQS